MQDQPGGNEKTLQTISSMSSMSSAQILSVAASKGLAIPGPHCLTYPGVRDFSFFFFALSLVGGFIEINH